MKTVLQSSEEINEWEKYQFKVPVATEFDQIRIEVNILKPGIFWIDNIQIEK
jgi:hypothetical protein